MSHWRLGAEGGLGRGEEGKERMDKEGAPIPLLAFPLLGQLGLTSPLSCLASVSPRVRGDAGL